MTKRVLEVCIAVIASAAVMGSLLALHYVPSPCSSVTRRGDSVVARLRPGTGFGLFRERTRIGEHIAGSESIDFHDGESVMLSSGHTGYRITCRVSPRPAGLFIQGSLSLHHFLPSAEENWVIQTHLDLRYVI